MAEAPEIIGTPAANRCDVAGIDMFQSGPARHLCQRWEDGDSGLIAIAVSASSKNTENGEQPANNLGLRNQSDSRGGFGSA